ncbi:MAG: 2-oxoacid:acceptor oxidoreductase family protein, partial [Candidatus Heimdallarchaeaceae archaeon]
MLEIRFHGRGGTGSVLASRALAKAAFYAGKHAVTFPSFGAERRGAPVIPYIRINEKPIYQRTQIYEPDMIVVLDKSLLE